MHAVIENAQDIFLPPASSKPVVIVVDRDALDAENKAKLEAAGYIVVEKRSGLYLEVIR